MRQIGEEDLGRAATVLVKTALRVTAGERFVAVGDLESQPTLAALEAAARSLGAEAASLRIDLLRSYSTNHSGERPHKVLPDAVRRAMLSAQASAFVASAPHAESSMRDQLLHCVGACRVRNAHMPGITPVAFSMGLVTDHGQIAEHARNFERKLEVAREIAVESPAGTKLVLRTGKDHRWVARAGLVGPGEHSAFPTGSIIATPEEVDGTFIATASLGEFFGLREGLLRDPVRFTIVGARVTGVACEKNPQLLKDIEAMLQVAPNSDRIGLAIIGCNRGILEPVGDVCVDQHRAGLHLVIGDPMTKATAAGWTARTSFAACQAKSSVLVDGALI
jgi:leucyl aminopeptidase (aminopeptidase T)